MNSTTNTLGPDAHYIQFGRGIDQDNINLLIEAISTLHEQTPDSSIVLMMNSDGGNVFAGLKGYSLLRSLDVDLTTINIGSVNSIANALFLAGNKRMCHSLSTFLWHGVGIDQKSPVRLDIPFMNQQIARLNIDHRKIGEIVADRTSLDLDVVMGLFGADTVQDAQWAINSGVVHEIVEPPFVPSNVKVHRLL